MGARVLLIASISIWLLPGNDRAYAEDAPNAPQALPPIVVTGTKPSAKPGRDQTASRAVRNLPRVLVYPTTPLAGSGIDPDKVPASVNSVDANQIKQTGSLNISDALQQYVPGIRVNK